MNNTFMHVRKRSLAFCLVIHCIGQLGLSTLTAQEKNYPDPAWQYVHDPRAWGWSTEKLEEAKVYSQSIGSAAVMIIENGLVVSEWGEVDENMHIFSIRKSLLNALYGIYVDRGKIQIHQTLADLGVDDKNPVLTGKEKRARIVDLLMSKSGVYHTAAYETPGMQKNRPKRESHEPGTHWYYNNWDFNALNTIFEKQTQLFLFETFEKEIARPLGMEDFRLENTETIREEVSVHPATVFRMSARDLARFGLLYLYDGVWQGKRILSKSWIKESTTPHSDLGMFGGYGYLWWVALKGEHFPFIKLPDGTFSARGTGEQNLLVIPSLNLVIVHRTRVEGTDNPMVKVTDFGRLLSKILAAKGLETSPW